MERPLKKPDHSEEAYNYAINVSRGKIPACKWVKLACRRHLSDLRRFKNGRGEYWFDGRKANKVCNFMENLPHIKGEWAKEGTNLKLEAWQKFILCAVFGWLRFDGRRRFKIAYIEIARKQGKSTLSAGIGLYMLTEDGESGGEIYSAAVTRDQAKIVFEAAQEMARKKETFRNHYGVRVNAHNINVLETASKFEAVSSEANSLDGLNTHCSLIDELHAHKTRQVFDVLETSMGARSQPLMWIITTAGSNRAGICYEQRSYLTKILQDQVEDDNYFGVIYTAEEKKNWKSPKTWALANPNLNVSFYEDEMKRLCNKAQELASAQNAFLTKHLNIWVNADQSWMNMEKWEKCGASLNIESYAGMDCWIGVDLASKIDIASVGVLFKERKDDDDEYIFFSKNYLPEENVHSEAHAKSAHYEGWAKEGWFTLTSGNMMDIDFIADEIRELLSKFNVKEVAFDPWQATQIMGQLGDEGATVVEVRPTVQNFSDPMKTLEALVGAKRFKHENNPVLNWMVSNVVCHRDAKDNIYPRKEQEQNKIDGVIALLMALNMALADDNSGSVYDGRGVIML
jgi:phage terminase large subunit-like protein